VQSPGDLSRDSSFQFLSVFSCSFFAISFG
jgi:hypothetical protein